MIVHDLSLAIKLVKIDSYEFCLMLALAVTQFETSVLFVFNLRFHIIPGVIMIIF